MQGLPNKNVPFERFLDSLGEACLLINAEGRILAANVAARSLYGAEEDALRGRSFAELCSEHERRRVREHLDSCDHTTPLEFTARQLREDGSSFLGSFTAKRHLLDDDPAHLTLIVRKLEAELRTCSEDLQLHHLMLESALDGVVAHTLDGEVLYANAAAQQQWGMTLEAARDRGPWGWLTPEDTGRVQEMMARLRAHGSARFEGVASGATGEPSHVEVHARIVDGPNEPIVVSTVRDISERLQTEEMVRYLAYHDDLTGLANRVHLQQELFQAISNANRYGDVLGVAFIDLDNFKPVNDSYGHATGDDVLREVADRISGCVRDVDTVARVGGDEFVVVLPRLADANDLQVVAEKLRREVSRPIEVAGQTVQVTASIGTAIHEPNEDAESLLNRADLGMYHARELNRDALEGRRPT